jgi:hypothetical protein
MAFKEALFWVGLTIFGTGLYFTVDKGNVSLPYAIALVVIGLAGVVYPVIRHHYPEKKLPAIRVWFLLLLATWGVLGYDVYLKWHPRIVEKIVEKPVDRVVEKIVTAPCLLPPTTGAQKPKPSAASPPASGSTQSNSGGTNAQYEQKCEGSACAQGPGSQATLNVDTPPLRLDWKARNIPSSDLPEKFKYGVYVDVAPNIIWQPVSLAIFCDHEIKELAAYGAMNRLSTSLAQESNKVGLVYYESPSLGAGVKLTIGIFSTNQFSVLDVRPAKINQQRNVLDRP